MAHKYRKRTPTGFLILIPLILLTTTLLLTPPAFTDDQLQDDITPTVFVHLPIALNHHPTPPPDVRIEHVEYNPPGSDLDGEYVRLHNYGANISLTNWTLSDAANHVYTFPQFTLSIEADVRIWVKTGTDTQTDLYWGLGSPIWNNDGDTATLRDNTGQIMDTYTY